MSKVIFPEPSLYVHVSVTALFRLLEWIKYVDIFYLWTIFGLVKIFFHLTKTFRLYIDVQTFIFERR